MLTAEGEKVQEQLLVFMNYHGEEINIPYPFMVRAETWFKNAGCKTTLTPSPDLSFIDKIIVNAWIRIVRLIETWR